MTEALHPFLELIRRRTSVEEFDAGRGLSQRQIRDLVEDATLAPSSFNIQHWRFVAVRTLEDRRRLREAAFGQEQVEQAAVTFIVLGDLKGVERLPEIMELAVDRGALPEGKAAAWVRMAREIYDDERVARDEAIRSATLAAMMLMLAAEARGLGSVALSGFDPERVKRDFHVPDHLLPVMLLAVGHPVDSSDRRMPRLTAEEVLAFDRCRGF